MTLSVDALAAEIGSTTTLVNAFDGLETVPRFVGQGVAETSVTAGDVLIGLNLAIDDLKRSLGADTLTWDAFFATSSAAGGLKMSVHGLVYDMTARAAKEAALGAGAMVRMVTAGKLCRDDLDELLALRPNIILLAGGTDYGEKETVLYNARAIASLQMRTTPVLFAGNVQAKSGVRRIFEDADLPLHVTENVYPKLDMLNVAPARREIQRLFEKHIVAAPGMEHLRDRVSGRILPTPGAVMEAAQLLYGVMGPLVALDIGGATTDVHSVCEESENIARMQTSAQPFAKRTVEGDLGLYLNAETVLNMGEPDAVTLPGYWPPIPKTAEHMALAEKLAVKAGQTALLRHAGTLRHLYTPSGRTTVAEGKDLTQCQTLIATGGALTRLPGREKILTKLRDMNGNGMMLYPRPNAMHIRIDNHYIMASLGVLSLHHPKAAVKLLQDSFGEE